MGGGGHADHAGEESAFPTIVQRVQKQPGQQKVAQVVHAKVLLQSIRRTALGNQRDTRFRHKNT